MGSWCGTSRTSNGLKEQAGISAAFVKGGMVKDDMADG